MEANWINIWFLCGRSRTQRATSSYHCTHTCPTIRSHASKVLLILHTETKNMLRKSNVRTDLDYQIAECVFDVGSELAFGECKVWPNSWNRFGEKIGIGFACRQPRFWHDLLMVPQVVQYLFWNSSSGGFALIFVWHIHDVCDGLRNIDIRNIHLRQSNGRSQSWVSLSLNITRQFILFERVYIILKSKIYLFL